MFDRGWSARRTSLLGTEVFVGGSAVYGALALMTDAWHLPLDYLDPLPWRSWFPAGVALLLVVAVPMLGAAALVLRGSRWAADVSFAAGVLLAGWVVVQVLIVGPRFWLQPLMFAVGLAVAVAARRRPGSTPAGTSRARSTGRVANGPILRS